MFCRVALVGAILVPLSSSQDAVAQGSRDVPIQRDLQQIERIDRDLNRRQRLQRNPIVSPDNPDGVVGFDSPGFLDNDVMDNGVLAPGSPADIGEN